MTTMDQVAEIKAFYDKLRKKIVKENGRALQQVDRAESAALKIFEKQATPVANGAAPKVRGSRLDPEIQKLVLAAMSTEIGYTANEIAKQSKASRSQVRTAIALALKAGKVAGDANKRNRKYVLTTEVEQRTE